MIKFYHLTKEELIYISLAATVAIEKSLTNGGAIIDGVQNIGKNDFTYMSFLRQKYIHFYDLTAIVEPFTEEDEEEYDSPSVVSLLILLFGEVSKGE